MLQASCGICCLACRRALGLCFRVNFSILSMGYNMQDERLSIFCSIERRIVEVVVLDTGALYVIFGLVIIVCVFLEHLGGVLLIHIVLLLLLSIDCIYDPFYQARMKCCFEPWEQRNSNNRMHVIG